MGQSTECNREPLAVDESPYQPPPSKAQGASQERRPKERQSW